MTYVRPPRRWFWQDEYGSLTPGWAITLIAAVLVVIGLGSYCRNDMHM